MHFAGVAAGLPAGPRPCRTFPDTVTNREGGWVPANIGIRSAICARAVHEREKDRRTWDGMAIEALHVVLCDRHAFHELFDSFRSLIGVPVPGERGAGPVEFWEVIYACGRVIGRIV